MINHGDHLGVPWFSDKPTLHLKSTAVNESSFEDIPMFNRIFKTHSVADVTSPCCWATIGVLRRAGEIRLLLQRHGADQNLPAIDHLRKGLENWEPTSPHPQRRDVNDGKTWKNDWKMMEKWWKSLKFTKYTMACRCWFPKQRTGLAANTRRQKKGTHVCRFKWNCVRNEESVGSIICHMSIWLCIYHHFALPRTHPEVIASDSPMTNSKGFPRTRELSKQVPSDKRPT